MREMEDKEFHDLLQRTKRTRQQFMAVELDLCSTSLEVAAFHLSVGNLEIVAKEIAATEAGIRFIRRALAGVVPEQRAHAEKRLAGIKSLLGPLKTQLGELLKQRVG